MIITGGSGTGRRHCPRYTDAYCTRHPLQERECIYECTVTGGQLMHKLQNWLRSPLTFINYAKHMKEAEGIDGNRVTKIKNIQSRMSEDQGWNAPPQLP
jgi:hypothetical protein